MIRTFALCSVSKLDDNRVCLSGIDTDKFFPVICFANLDDLEVDLKHYLVDVFSRSNRSYPLNFYKNESDDVPALIEFRYCLTYVFYRCKDGKFRTYLR